MVRYFIALTCIASLFLYVSCRDKTPQAEPAKTGTEKGTEGKSPALNLPCFGCHSYERFKNPKVFPHETHRAMGIHCTECHVIRAHESISVNREACNGCHRLGVMKLSLTGMPSIFTHDRHTQKFGCKECHPGLFPMKVNSAKITMEEINKGGSCGKCHNGKAAFSAEDCSRCHK